MPTPCFMVQRTGRTQVSLRRFADPVLRGAPCSAHWWHEESVPIEVVDDPDGRRPGILYGPGDVEPKADPRWPVSCACGYAFQPDDSWMEQVEWLFHLPDGSEVTQRNLPAGAMWLEPGPHLGGHEGEHLMVVLPDGTRWDIDGPARNGGTWTRSGEPPMVTVAPSIASPRYHGFLRDGVLTDPV